jgi:hypothetical protein
MKPLQTALAGLYAVILLLPGYQMLTGTFAPQNLHGFSEPAARALFSWRGFSRGEFQEKLDRWLADNVGLRAHAILTDNQINYSIFGESRIRTGDIPIVGRDHVMFTRPYIESYCRIRPTNMTDPADYARRLRRLQTLLENNGVFFLFVIAPNKAELMPGAIPPAYQRSVNRTRQTDYERLSPCLQAENVRTLDVRRLFADEMKRSATQLFPPGGVHWNSYGAFLAASNALSEYRAWSGKAAPQLSCASLPMSFTPSWTDAEMDAEDLLNVWQPVRNGGRFPRPRLIQTQPEPVARPDVLIVGDSFGHQFAGILNNHQCLARLNFWYYFGTDYAFPEGKESSLDKARIDWKKDLFGRDIVIVLCNEIQLDSEAWGFMNAALAGLEGATP